MTTIGSRPSIRLTCLDGESCRVFIEPWGTELILQRGDILRIESNAFSTGHVEISYIASGVVVGFTSDDPIEITDREGKQIPI